MQKVLLLEDDDLFAQTVREFLEEEGFVVVCCNTGAKAEEIAYEEHFDLFLFDINLPDMSGFDVTQTIRGNKISKPILFLTSSREKSSLLKSFELGGDEYLTKPVDFDELLVRIHALLKRSGGAGEVKLFDGFSFDFTKKSLYKEHRLVELGNKAAHLLSLFVENREKPVTKEMIDIALYSNQSYSEGSVRVYVNQLNSVFGKKVIKNIRGVGYIFETNE